MDTVWKRIHTPSRLGYSNIYLFFNEYTYFILLLQIPKSSCVQAHRALALRAAILFDVDGRNRPTVFFSVYCWILRVFYFVCSFYYLVHQ